MNQGTFSDYHLRWGYAHEFTGGLCFGKDNNYINFDAFKGELNINAKTILTQVLYLIITF